MSKVKKVKGKKINPEERAKLDRQLESMLNFRLNELAARSSACWNFALKEYERAGRGVVYWQFDSLEDAKTKADQPIVYRSEERVNAMEYEPAIKFCKLYVPNKACVALVAIKTGDERDSLMKCMLLERYTEEAVRVAGYTPVFPTLKFQIAADKEMVIAPGLRFCSNPLCYKLEQTENEFKKCERCKFRPYCSRECQVIHWKTLHKMLCPSEAQLTEYFDKRPTLTDFKRLEEERQQQQQQQQQLEELAAKLAELKAAAPSGPSQAPTIVTDASGQPALAVSQ